MRILISALLICGFALTSAAQEAGQKKKKGAGSKETKLSAVSLDELLAQALKENPDIRVSDAKVREAEAELNRTRLAVMQKVTKAYHELAGRKAILAEAKARLDRANALYKTAAIGQDELSLARLTLERAAAEVAELEAELPYLVGKRQPVQMFWDLSGPSVSWVEGHGRGMRDLEMAFRNWTSAVAQPRGTLADKVRKALDAPVTANFKNKPTEEVMEFFRAQFEAEFINFYHDRVRINPNTLTVQIKEPIPLGAALQLLEDQIFESGRFVVREYGIVFAPPSMLPPGAVFVVDFWKSKPPDTYTKP